MMNRVKIVPRVIPPTKTSPMELRAAAPAPVTSTSGKWPATVAMVVIMIGRKRTLAASRTAWSFSTPAR